MQKRKIRFVGAYKMYSDIDEMYSSKDRKLESLLSADSKMCSAFSGGQAEKVL